FPHNDLRPGPTPASRPEVRPFSDKEIALLQNFAAQAVIAMENARLLTETREALAEQTATAEVLQVINSSPGELTPVFDALFEKATRLCAASHGVLGTFAGELLHRAAVHGESNVLERERQRGPVRAAGGLLRGILDGENLIHIADVRETDTWRDYPAVRERLEAGGVRSWLGVALRKDDALLGTIQVYRQEVRPFSEKEIALLENFAEQAVIQMENARHLTETREALEQQPATAEVLQVINSSPGDLAPVFDAILERAHRLCSATRGALALYDGESFRAAAIHGYPEEVAAEIPRPYGSNVFFQRIVDGDRYVQISGCPSGGGAARRSGGAGSPGSFGYAHLAGGASAQRGRAARLYFGNSLRSAAVFREGDCAARKFRGAGSHCDGERTALNRDAR